MKRITIALFIVLGCWVIYSFFQAPVWNGESKNNKWKVAYYQDHSYKDTWEGILYWNGHGEVILKSLLFMVEGEVIIARSNNDAITDKLSFIALGERLNEKSEVKVVITWLDNENEEVVDDIIIKPHKKLIF
ncbi:DUF4944 domain-containing protein [Caldalkalibacillus mannanilyticus]|uniref:DUF4944 domain-containing protein n=1 Tax=Caldalkalibacillus mannanilyticus TaxID=1418 RepID=UPI000468C06D|nr:DUF4944 domain-containing protein [Caldalkalibacillus mannanilyticus]